MSETHAKDRKSAVRQPDEFKTNASLVRRARTRGKDDRIRLHRQGFCCGQFVIAPDDDFRPELSQVVEQVVGKAVVVIDQQQQDTPNSLKLKTYSISGGHSWPFSTPIYDVLAGCWKTSFAERSR